MQHVPATESKVEPIRDNDQNSLCSCTRKNKMVAISSGARAAAFDWNDLDRKRKLLVILMMMIDDAFLVFCLLAFSFSCLSHRIELSLKLAISIRVWFIIPRNMTAVFRIFSWRIILNRFYFNGRHFTSTMQCLKACRALPKLCTMRSVSSHEETCRCNISLGHVPATFSCVCKCCDFVDATCPRYTSLLHVASVCTTHVFVAATCCCNMTPRVWTP